MGRPLRVLLIEDNEEDATLILRELKRGGFEVKWERVDTPEALEAALEWESWQVVLADYAMPRFSAPDALAIVKGKGLDLPFIIISGAVGEDTAVDAMRLGAHDYLLKDRLTRLVPAIERELREASNRADRKRMQEQLVLSDRMVSVGALAAGAAEELAIPLLALQASLERVAQQIVGGAEAGGALDEARASAGGVRQTLDDLRLLADDERRGALDVHRVLDSALRLAGHAARRKAKLVLEFADLPLVEGQPGLLAQVFLNLILNACRAIPDGKVEENEIRVVTRYETSDRIAVEVRDTGPALSPAMQRRIFEPFITTRPDGGTTGLGLAICRRIVTELGGDIAVESQIGEGSVLRVLLPVAQGQGTTREIAARPA